MVILPTGGRVSARNRRKRAFGGLHLLALMIMCGAGWGAGAAEPSRLAPWTLIQERYGAAAVTDGRSLFVLGGANALGAVGSIEKVDLATGISTLLPIRLINRRFHAAVIIGREIYVFGGEADEGFISNVQVVDVDTPAVRKIGPMPTPRRALSAVGVENFIFTLGGSAPDDSEYLPRSNKVEVYDVDKKEWLTAPPMPGAREVATVLNDHYLYQLGGYNGTGHAEKSCQRYDLKTGKWGSLSPAPFPLSAYSAVSIGDAIVCFGDYEEKGRVVAYRPADGTWRVLAVPFTPRRHSAACIAKGWVYVVGGNTETETLGHVKNTIERYRVEDLQAAVLKAEKLP